MQPTLRQMPPNVPPSTMAICRSASRRPGMVLADPLTMMHVLIVPADGNRSRRSQPSIGTSSRRRICRRSCLRGQGGPGVDAGPEPEVMLPFGFVEMLDGVAQGDARHPRGVLVEELPQGIPVNSLACFPQ